MKLAPHFSLDEFLVSETAARQGIDNTPTPQALRGLERVARMLEMVSVLFNGKPIIITSGYRCPALNAAVGGARDSAHMDGLAADIIVPAWGPPIEVAKTIAANATIMANVDQLIHEFGRWVHIGLSSDAPRQQLLTIDRNGTRMGLLPV